MTAGGSVSEEMHVEQSLVGCVRAMGSFSLRARAPANPFRAAS